MKRRTRATIWRAVRVMIAALGLVLSSGAAQRVFGAASTDYPGPCSGEATGPGTPLYISSDGDSRPRHFGFIELPEVGRFRLGISCVDTLFFVLRVGPDSALCTSLGFCTDADFMHFGTDDAFHILGNFPPSQGPFSHDCFKHGFGWYDVVSVPPGRYLAVAFSGPGFLPYANGGHGTMDTYAFFGNGGQYQPVNCSPPGGGGGGGGGGGDPGGGGGELVY